MASSEFFFGTSSSSSTLHARTHINEPQICSSGGGYVWKQKVLADWNNPRRWLWTPSRWIVNLKIIRSPAPNSRILWFIPVLSLPQPRSVFAVYLHSMLICWQRRLWRKKKKKESNPNGSTLSNKWFDKMIMIMVLKINLIITAFYSNVRCHQLRQH